MSKGICLFFHTLYTYANILATNSKVNTKGKASWEYRLYDALWLRTNCDVFGFSYQDDPIVRGLCFESQLAQNSKRHEDTLAYYIFCFTCWLNCWDTQDLSLMSYVCRARGSKRFIETPKVNHLLATKFLSDHTNNRRIISILQRHTVIM